MRAILDDEGPAGDLRAHIEELGHDPLPVPHIPQQPSQRRRKRPGLPGFLLPGRHPHQQHQHENRHQHDTDDRIRSDHHRQVRRLDGLERGIVQDGTLRRAQRVHTGLDEIHRHPHPAQRPDRIERLRQVQPACRRLLVAHRQDERIGRCLQERKAAGQDEIRDQERIIAPDLRRRDEHQGAECIQAQAHQDAALVGKPADKQGRRQGHAEIASVEGHLHQRPVSHAHPEDFRERLDHRIGNVIGKAPQRKAAGHQNEREHIADPVPIFQNAHRNSLYIK